MGIEIPKLPRKKAEEKKEEPPVEKPDISTEKILSGEVSMVDHPPLELIKKAEENKEDVPKEKCFFCKKGVDECDCSSPGDITKKESEGEDRAEFIQELVDRMQGGEGALTDYLYGEGYEFDEVQDMIAEVHKAMKSGVKPKTNGMYASGGPEGIIEDKEDFDADAFFDGDEEDEGEEDKDKKAKKSSKFDDPVEEVLSMLKEGQPIPLKLAEKLLGTSENMERLLAKDENVVKTKYQIMFVDEEDELDRAYAGLPPVD